MEMLAEMEGSEETLKGLNDAEHRPEDSMQTDEWMYELKHRKSWATGKYVPQEGLTVSKEGEDGAMPPNWQERLSQEQVNLVKDTWGEVADKKLFAVTVHNMVAKVHVPAKDLPADEQAQKIIATIDSTISALTTPSSKPSTAPLTQCFRDYNLNDPSTHPLFGDAIISALASVLGKRFTDSAREAWGCAYGLLSAAALEDG